MTIRALLLLLFAALPAQAAAEEFSAGPDAAPPDFKLVIHGSTDIRVFRPLVEAFSQARPALRITYVERVTHTLHAEAVADCAAGSARADLLISSAMDLQVSLVNDHCAKAYASDLTAALPDWANWRNEAFGLTLEPAVLIYDRRRFTPDKIPHTHYELVDFLRANPALFDGRVATYDISEAGIGYLFAFSDAQSATTFGRLVETLGRLRTDLLCCAASMIDGVASGDYLIAYNVLGSYAAERAETNPDIGIVHFDDYNLAISRTAVIPRHAKHAELAGSFIDFALSPAGRRVLMQMHLIPEQAELASALEPIPLGVPLLAGLDAQKKDDFISVFDSAFVPIVTQH